jgi:hypothetical protein
MAFTNVDYNKGYHPDSNPFEEAMESSLEKVKNFTAEALAKKKSAFMAKLSDYFEQNMLPPEGAEAIISDPDTGTLSLDPGFYKILEYTPEAMWKETQRLAQMEGFGPNTITKNEIYENFDSLRNYVAQRQYKMLAELQDKHGTRALETILAQEGGKFNTFSREFQDPYSLPAITRAQAKLDQKRDKDYREQLGLSGVSSAGEGIEYLLGGWGDPNARTGPDAIKNIGRVINPLYGPIYDAFEKLIK